MKRKSLFIFTVAALLALFATSVAFAGNLPFDSMKIVYGSSGYLYEANYQPTTDEGFKAANAICKMIFLPAPGCSSVRKGKFYGRNFDYDFDSFADVVSHTPAGNGHYAVMSVDGGMLGRALGTLTGGFTKERLDEILAGDTPSTMEISWLTLLPYVAVDGINEKGLVCNINVAQQGKDIGLTTGTNPDAKQDLYVALCPRYILDKCATADEAIKTMRKLNIWAETGLKENIQTQYHIMIADANNTYVVEFKNNKMLVKEISDKPYMTNFNLLTGEGKTIGYDLNGHVDRTTVINYTGGDYEGKFDQGNGHGISRYNTIVDAYAKLSNRASFRKLLDSVSYAHRYQEPKTRFDDFVGNNTKYEKYIPGMGDDLRYLTLENATNKMDELCEKYDFENAMLQLLSEMDRNQEQHYTHTVHSCIYDIAEKKLWIKEQELGKEPGAWSGEHCFTFYHDGSSGCNAGFGLLALLFAAPLFYRKKK